MSFFIQSSNQDIAAAVSMRNGPPRLYALVSVGLTTYNRLIRIAEHAYCGRNIKALEQASRELLAFDSDAALYYLAIVAKRQGRTEEARRLFESIRGPYQARAIHALGAIHYEAGRFDEAAKFYTEAIHANRGHDLLALVNSRLQASAIKSARGKHAQSLDDLLSLWPVVRTAARQYSHLWPSLHGEIACELFELGKVEEAKRAVSVAISSPLADVYPEWQETACAIAESERQTILVVVPARKQKVIIRFPFVCTAFELPRSHLITVSATAAINCYITTQRTLELLGKCIKARAPPPHS